MLDMDKKWRSPELKDPVPKSVKATECDLATKL